MITREPTFIQPAFNPVIVMDDAARQLPVTTVTAGRTILRHVKGIFNLSGMLSTLFHQHREVVNNNAQYQWAFEDQMLSQIYNYGTANKYAINGVVQPGESTDLILSARSMWHSERVNESQPTLAITKYTGYPVGITVSWKDRYAQLQSPHVVAVSESQLSDAVDVTRHITFEFTPGNSTFDVHWLYLTDADGVNHYERVEFVSGCVPDSPFYIRWINTLGGYDYYMWSRNKTVREELSDVVNIRQYSRQHKSISANASKTITVGEDKLDSADHRLLRSIQQSPLIEWWDEKNMMWQTLVIDDSSTQEWGVDSGLWSIEYTFMLPGIDTQFL